MMPRDKRRMRGGYYNLGRIQIPALPQGLILTDRASGIKYLLSWENTVSTIDNVGHITINSDVSLAMQGVKEFEADDGPKFGNDGEYTLFIRAGRIGIEFEPYPLVVSDRDDAPIFARKRGSKFIREVYLSLTGSRNGNEVLAFTQEDFPL